MMNEADPMMQSMLWACVVLLVVPTTVLGITVIWYVRNRRRPQQS